jgi:hypothetical protein
MAGRNTTAQHARRHARGRGTDQTPPLSERSRTSSDGWWPQGAGGLVFSGWIATIVPGGRLKSCVRVDSFVSTAWSGRRLGSGSRSGRGWRALMGGILAGLAWLAAGLAVFCSPALALPNTGGSGWSVQRAPNPKRPRNSQLVAVSCASVKACVAVGSSVTDRGKKSVTLAEHWNGERWTIGASPNQKAPKNVLSGISCWSKSGCVAVGASFQGLYYQPSTPLVERWNGRRWRVQPTPATGFEIVELNSVSCWSATGCVAVGDISSGNGYELLAERWNGRRWVIQRSPDSTGTDLYGLSGVSCTSRRACVAVGGAGAERWDGRKWTIQHLPVRGPGSVELSGVSCWSARGCIAVGFSDYRPCTPGYSDYCKGDQVLTFAERWNGARWTSQRSRNPAGTGEYSTNEFDSISCVSAEACTAVGTTYTPLVERWTGDRWSVQRTAHNEGTLAGVSCPSARRCTAVGNHYSSNSDVDRTLVERWTS